MATCNEYIVVPTLPSDPCNGERGNTRCIYSEDAFSLLGLAADSSLDVILNAMVVAINAQNNLNIAQNTAIEALENGGQPYKVYRAILNQSGTNAPVATVLENTIGNIVWSRNSPGTYSATLVGAFQANKTFYPTFGTSNSFNRVYTNRLNDDVMSIVSISEDLTAYLDNELFNYPIEILVYE
jgi:hypothetical protein